MYVCFHCLRPLTCLVMLFCNKLSKCQFAMTSSNILAVKMITSFSVEDYVWKINSYTAIPDVNGTWTRPNRAKSSAITIPTAVIYIISQFPLRWRHNGRDGVSNHQPHSCFSTVYSVEDHREHQSSALLALVQGSHRRPVNSPHKWPVTRNMFSFDGVFMFFYCNL